MSYSIVDSPELNTIIVKALDALSDMIVKKTMESYKEPQFYSIPKACKKLGMSRTTVMSKMLVSFDDVNDYFEYKQKTKGGKLVYYNYSSRQGVVIWE